MRPDGPEGVADVRVRFRYAKLGKVRFTSQRDVARMWERALRRAALPVAYSKGFSPRPQLSFGLALPTGCESLAEYVDVSFDEERTGPGGLEASTLSPQLSGFMPEGVEIVAAAAVERGPSSLQEEVSSCEWEIRLRGAEVPAVEEMVAAFLAAEAVTVSRERKGRIAADDIRPAVLALAATDQDGAAALVAETATHPRGIRPAELVQGIAVAAGAAGTGDAADGVAAGSPVLDRACRTKQWIEREGCRVEPLPAGDGHAASGRAVHTAVCAS
jgi:radical SAM-linked protein